MGSASHQSARIAPSSRPSRFSVRRLLLLGLVYGLSLGAAAIYFAIATINRDLPKDLTVLIDYQPARRSTLFSSDGIQVGTFAFENRRMAMLERMPPHVPAAFISAEDRRFFGHKGFDLVGIIRAGIKNVRATGIKQGGSTLTQQIIKQTLLADEEEIVELGLSAEALAKAKKRAKYQRKFKEIVLAARLERELKKADILSIYLNHVYLGHGAYGVGAAAQIYFGKDVENLTIAEAALLAGVVASPSKYAPTTNITLARERQLYVLDHMRDEGYISVAQYQAARQEPLAFVGADELNHSVAPAFVEHVRKAAQEEFGTTNLFTKGYRMYATLDMRKQAIAEAALRRGLERLDKRLGFRGPASHIEPAAQNAWRTQRYLWQGAKLVPLATKTIDNNLIVAGMVTEAGKGQLSVTVGDTRYALDADDAKRVLAWRPKEPTANVKGIRIGDVLPIRVQPDTQTAELAQRPEVEGALIAMEPATGRIVAMVGGYDPTASQFNRATQARRQVGSSIKPFIYASALAAGKTPVDVYVDGPQHIMTAAGVWSPANYDNKYHGAVTLQNALAQSLNTISVQLVLAVGVDRIIQILRDFGIAAELPRHISISLGTPDVTLLEMATAYAGIANGGRRVTPRLYDFITTSDGAMVKDFRALPPGPQVLAPEVAYVLIHMMKGVVSRGTARAATALGRPAGGKTGTSANYRDVWFIGFTRDLLVGVWIGRDDSKSIGDKITGGGAAVPIWLEFMQRAHPDTPIRDFEIPPGVSFARVDPWGNRPTGPSNQAVWVPFVEGTMPASFLSAKGP